MFYIHRISLVFLSVAMLGVVPLSAQETPPAGNELKISPELLEMLRAEMRALLSGVQSLPAGIAMADWKSVATTGAQMRASYILDQELTAAQKKELGASLPEHFKRLDADFHLESKKLEEAATNHDAQLSAFHFYRLIETCTACHSVYAAAKFPGFTPTTEHTHDH
jgi:hypothetical protein